MVSHRLLRSDEDWLHYLFFLSESLPVLDVNTHNPHLPGDSLLIPEMNLFQSPNKLQDSCDENSLQGPDVPGQAATDHHHKIWAQGAAKCTVFFPSSSPNEFRRIVFRT